jgi:hydroxyethylthiazole kinase-like uncharacterized protein yjeF
MIDILPSNLPAAPAARAVDSHKGDFGAVGILGGAPGTTGAALLAGRTALLAGSGRVYVGLLDPRVAVDPFMPELMLPEPHQLFELPLPACLVCGPGLGKGEQARQLLADSLKVNYSLVLDADALNLLADEPGLRGRVRARTAPTLITPHPGEAARLLQTDTGKVQQDRAAAVHALARNYNAWAVLKGAGTLVHGPGGKVWRNGTGNPGMAVAGMGDVLAGLIAALLAQGMNSEEAAVLGVWLHGAAGDAAVEKYAGEIGITASEVAKLIRLILNRLQAERARTA